MYIPSYLLIAAEYLIGGHFCCCFCRCCFWRAPIQFAWLASFTPFLLLYACVFLFVRSFAMAHCLLAQLLSLFWRADFDGIVVSTDVCRNYLRSGWILNSHGLIYAAITYRAPTNQTSERREKKTLSSISDARYKRVWRLVDDQHENSFLTALIRCSFSGLYRAFRFHHDDI